MQLRSIIAFMLTTATPLSAGAQTADPLQIQREIDARALAIFARVMTAGTSHPSRSDCDFDTVARRAKALADAAETADKEPTRDAVDEVAGAYRDIPSCASSNGNNAGEAAMIQSYRTATLEVLEAHRNRLPQPADR